MLRLEERDVPATTFTGTVYLDTNANGQFNAVPVTINTVGTGTTTLTAEVGYNGLASPFDPVSSRVPVLVRAFDSANNVAGQAETALDGTYTLTVAAGGAYRLEFSNLPAGVGYGPSGQTTGTAVQTAGVVTDGSTGGLNLALVRADDVTPDNPLLVTSSYVFGAFDSGNANDPVVLGFPYNAGSDITGSGNAAASQPGFERPEDNPVAIPHSQVGTTWGLAYNKATNQLYMAAFDKRHAGFGPGTGNPATAQGQIYAAVPPANGSATPTTTATPFVNLEQLVPGSTGVNYRAQPAFTDPANTGVDSGGNQINPYIRDGLYLRTGADGVQRQVGWDAVGKLGLGGLDADPSGRFLYTVALGDRRLYVIDTRNPSAGLQSFALPSPASVTGKTTANPLGDIQPFAVQYYRGSIYVGAVNSGESTISVANPVGDPNSLNAYVFQFRLAVDATGNTTTGGGQFVNLAGAGTATDAVLSVPLNYDRGFVQVGVADPSQVNDPGFTGPIPAEWRPWSPTFQTLTNPNGPIRNIGIYPQPMLTGLAFDTNGDITLGIRDRSGDQFGVQTPSNIANPDLLYTGIPGGDTLKAFATPNVPARWAIESNGRGPNGTPASAEGVGNGQGPGGGEFYAGEFLVPGMIPGQNDHQELSSGGVLQLPGYADLATTIFDPAQVSRRYNSGGVRWFRNQGAQAGSAVRAYELYQTNVQFNVPVDTFAKANGVGDLVAVTNAPTEIGNLVWADLNKNGRQDPEDPGLAGVQVVLFQGNNPLATATTDSAGNYFFTSQADPGAAGRVPGKTYGVSGLVRDSGYQIRIPLAQTPLRALTVTTANAAEDQRDSDATVVGTNAVIPVSTAGLLPGGADHTNDAGFVFNLSLGDFVWNDLNNNGTWETTEPRFSGVRVELVDTIANAVIASQTTNAQGGYLFTGLNPGTYRVQVPLAAALNPNLIGFRSSTGTNGSAFGPNELASNVAVQAANNADSGTTVGPVVIGPNVVLAVGTAPTGETGSAFPNGDNGIPDVSTDDNSNRLQDFGFFRPLSVGDVVWNDLNNNGARDVGEPGIANVTVQLLDVAAAGAPVVAATVTNAAGGYLFTNLTGGTYQLRIVRTAATAGFRSSTGANGSRTGPSEPVALGDAGNDRDHGTENGSLFIDGIPVVLSAGNAIAVDPLTIPAGLPADPAALDSRYRTQDFGLFQPLELGNLVWEDINNDGVQQGGVEPGVAGIVLRLFDATGAPVVNGVGPVLATTDANGNYLFTDLVAGSYTIQFTAPNGFRSSTGVNAARTGPFEPGLAGNDLSDFADHGTQDVGSQTIRSTVVTLGAPAVTVDTTRDGGLNRANLRQDFGIIRRLSLGDFVWNDANNNASFDAGEVPLGGVTVRLLFGNGVPVSANGQFITATTAADGGYLFTDLSPGPYQVEVVIPTGFRSSTNPLPVGPDTPDNVDHGEEAAGGLVVRGPVVTLSAGLAPTGESGVPSADLLDAGTPDANSYRTQDFGFFRPAPPPPPPLLAVGDFVWFDTDNDGAFDAGESPAANVPVRLLAASGTVVGSTVTDANGLYRFDGLSAGRYFVEIDAPNGFNSSTGADNAFEPAAQSLLNSTDKGTGAGGQVIRTESFVLAATGNPDENGTANLRQDFGLIENPTVPPLPLAVGDFVWFDADNDGAFDAGETPAANVPVRLLDAAGAVIGSLVTDANGLYRFGNLRAGTYAVEITAPAGFTSSTGGNNAFEPARQSLDNSTDKGTGVGNQVIRTDSFVLAESGNPDEAGTANLRQDFGLISPPVPPIPPPPIPPPPIPPPPVPPTTVPASIGGRVFLDADGSATFNAGDRAIPGTRVYLDGLVNGTRVTLTQLTDRDGRYNFTNLAPGLYTVREQQPGGQLFDGVDFVGTVGGAVRGTLGNDSLSVVNLSGGDAGVNYDFSELPTGAVFGYTWLDADRDGVFESGETPIPNVAVTISGTAFPGTRYARPLTAADVPGGLTVQTNALGRYDFPTLPLGVYTLSEAQPSGYIDWQEQDGDPNAGRPAITNDLFTGVALSFGTPIRGPLNFGETLINTEEVRRRSPQLPQDITKRSLLGSTGAASATSTAGVFVDPIPGTPGVVAAVTGYDLTPNLSLAGQTGADPAVVAVGAGPGASPLVRVFDYASGLERFRFLAYEPNYQGGVRTATGDITGDGVPDVVTATGAGGGPRLRAFDGQTGAVIADFFAYEESYRGGLSLAVADVTGDGRADIVTGTDQGGGPRVRAFDGRTMTAVQDFFAFDQSQRGGVRVAAADFTGDGRADIVTTTGAGVPTRVRVFDSATGTAVRDFAPYESNFTGGIYVAAGDFNGDGTPDIVTGADAGGGPRVTVFSGTNGATLANFFAYESTFVGGVRVAAADLNGDGRSEIVTAAGSGGGARVTVYSGAGVNVVEDFFAFDATLAGGAYVSAGAAPRQTHADTGIPAEPGQLGRPGTLPDLAL